MDNMNHKYKETIHKPTAQTEEKFRWLQVDGGNRLAPKGIETKNRSHGMRTAFLMTTIKILTNYLNTHNTTMRQILFNLFAKTINT